MTKVQRDHAVLFSLRACASTVPVANEMLFDTKDLMSTVVEVILVTFNKGKYSLTYVPGRRVLATCVNILPSNDIIEDHHRHIRHLSHIGVNLVTSRASRMRACVGSGILEQRGIPHRKVTGDQFFREFSRRRRVAASWRYNSRKTNLSKRWTRMCDRTA